MKIRLRPATAILFLLLAVPATAPAGNISVPGDQPSIQAAIDAASPGDAITVAPGTYRENINFKGKAIGVQSSGGPEVTIIDGNQAGPVVTFAPEESGQASLCGFTIQNGNAQYSEGAGGISISHASPFILSNRITGNRSAYMAAGISIDSGSPVLSANVITANSGGGIYITGAGSAQIMNNEISDNTSSYVGGIYLFGAGTPIIVSNVIRGNTGYYAGGMQTVQECAARIEQNLVVNNRTSNPNGPGGIGLYIPDGSGPTLLNNTVAGNEAPQFSGIYAAGSLSHTLLVNNVIVGNSGNTAIHCAPLAPPLMSHNLAYASSGTAYSGSCAGQSGVNGNIQQDPRFSAPEAGIYYPLQDSPVIDAGDASSVTLPPVDLESAIRSVDGNFDGQPQVDLGVYEFALFRPQVVLATDTSALSRSTSATFTVSGTGVVAYRYSLDGASFNYDEAPVETPLTLSNLSAGPHTLRVIGRDADGRGQYQSAATTATWSVDPTAPVTSATTAGGSFLSPLVVGLSCLDGSLGSGCADTFYCTGTGCSPTTRYHGEQIFIASSSELSFYSTDLAGNREDVKTLSYLIAFPDSAPPVITTFSIPGTFSSLTIPVTLFASDDRSVEHYCLTESADATGCVWSPTPPSRYTLSGSAAHTLFAFVRDGAGNVSAPASATTTPDPDFIPAAGRVDMVHDSGRDILYITSGDSVLRYRLGTASFLPPLRLGGRLAGIDLSPDGNSLAVADRDFIGIHLVDLRTGSSSRVPFSPAPGEGGSYSVAFGSDGAVLATAQFQGYAEALPLRRYDLGSGETKVLDRLSQEAMLWPGGGGACIAYSGSGAPDGALGIYDVTTQSLTHKGRPQRAGYYFGANRDCTKLVLPTDGATFVFDALRDDIADVLLYATPAPLGVTYRPGTDVVFLARSGSNELRAYDTKSLTQTGSYDFSAPFSDSDPTGIVPGRLRFSRDGAMLFAAVPDGVRVRRLENAPVAESQTVVGNGNGATGITLTGRSAFGTPLTYDIVSFPLHGTLAGAAPRLSYTPQAGYAGPDSFSFSVREGSVSSSPAQVEIAVTQGAVPAVTSFSLPSPYPSLLVPIQLETSGAVSAYCISERQDGSDCGWSPRIPESYPFKAAGTFTVYALVRDESGHVSAPVAATVTVAATGPSGDSDTVAPTVTLFEVPASSYSLTVPVRISGSDDSSGVTGYCLSESADPRGCSWDSSGSYTFGEYGPHHLFGFVRDAAGNVSVPATATVTVTGPKNFIPAADAFDMVYDEARDVLYITNDKSVLRYHLGTGAFLPPYSFNSLGEYGNLMGVDLSPDGTTLAVADSRLAGVHLVDLGTDTVLPDITFIPEWGEGGGRDVAFGKDGNVLVSSDYAGSGWTPMRLVNPRTGAVTVVNKGAMQLDRFNMPMLSASADGSCIGYAEGNSSDGPLGIFDVAGGKVSAFLQGETGTKSFNSDIATARDCSQFAVIGSSRAFIFDASLNNIKTFGAPTTEGPVGAAYHPGHDTLFLSWGGTDEVRAYDARTFAQSASYRFDSSFDPFSFTQGRLKLSRDGSLLFAAVQNGIAYKRLGSGPAAEDQAVAAAMDVPVTVYLTGSNLRSPQPSYRIVTGPSHGTLTGSAPLLTYTPASSFSGRDSFSFAIDDGTQTSNTATVSLAVSADRTPPVIDAISLASPATSMTVQVRDFSARDDIGVAWYCLTESASSSACTWSNRPPVNYTFSAPLPPQGKALIRTLYAFVRDAALNVSNPAATAAVITTPDTTAPTMVGFRIPTTHVGLTIPVTMLAADNASYVDYCLSEGESPQSCTWKYGAPPALYTFGSGGKHKLYAYARDREGNVSPPSSAETTVLLSPSFTSAAEASFAAGTQGSFLITTEGYPAPSFSVAGTLPEGVSFADNGNGSATLSGSATVGGATVYRLTITGSNGVGNPASQSFTLTVTRQLPNLIVSTVTDHAVVTRPELNITGIATSPNGIRSIQVNGQSVPFGAGGGFSWPVHLMNGSNSVTIAVTDNGGSTITETRTIGLDAAGARLTVSTPEDGLASSSRFIEISGTADSSADVTYAVNPCPAPHPPGSCGVAGSAARDGSGFSATVPLDVGLNTVHISATAAGSTTSVKRTIFYAPSFSLAVREPGSDVKTGAADYLLKGKVSDNSSPVTVTVEVDGRSFTPALVAGAFEQHLPLDQEKVYQVTVTATDLNGTAVTVQRNITRVWLGDSTGASAGSGAVGIADAQHVLAIAGGIKQPSATELLRLDTAPLSADGKAQGDGVIDLADVILALRKAIGLLNW